MGALGWPKFSSQLTDNIKARRVQGGLTGQHSHGKWSLSGSQPSCIWGLEFFCCSSHKVSVIMNMSLLWGILHLHSGWHHMTSPGHFLLPNSRLFFVWDLRNNASKVISLNWVFIYTQRNGLQRPGDCVLMKTYTCVTSLPLTRTHNASITTKSSLVPFSSRFFTSEITSGLISTTVA